MVAIPTKRPLLERFRASASSPNMNLHCRNLDFKQYRKMDVLAPI